MQLFFISHENDDGENMDLFVWANDRDEAVKLWRNWDFVADYYDNDPDPNAVFIVPLEAPLNPTILSWHSEVKPA